MTFCDPSILSPDCKRKDCEACKRFRDLEEKVCEEIGMFGVSVAIEPTTDVERSVDNIMRLFRQKCSSLLSSQIGEGNIKKIIIDWYKRLLKTSTYDEGRDCMVFKKNGDWIRKNEVYRLVMFLEGRIKTL